MQDHDSKVRRLALLRDKQEVLDGLPHLYGFPFYKWAREFHECREKTQILMAANQIGKSSTQIRKIIHWATETDLWPELWINKPRVFWYLYPDKNQTTQEVMKKWIPEFLPRGRFKADKKYGWELEKKFDFAYAIHFYSGVSLYFKTYGTDPQNLQTGTVWYVATDEELPSSLWGELNFRRAATNGYFSLVCTPTVGQSFWKRAIEMRGTAQETLKGAWKKQVSLLDCHQYEDGSPSPWTRERINQVINSCQSKAEIDMRVHGKFVVAHGLKYPSFQRERNVTPFTKLDPSWAVYSAVDYGSGGAEGHKSAIIFIAVSPCLTKGRVFRGWRGESEETTAGDLFQKYLEVKKGLLITLQCYDYSARDFFTIAQRSGEHFHRAEKSHELGESVVNTLFKNQMLTIDNIPELEGLVDELENVTKMQKKTKAEDDFIDALRYCAVKVPWAWESITGEEIIDLKSNKKDQTLRNLDPRSLYFDEDDEGEIGVESEMEEYNDLLGY